MKVYILMDTTESTRRESIIGVFGSLESAKLELANYVLSAEVDKIKPYYIKITEFEVEK